MSVKLDPTIALGSVINAGVILITIGIAWGTLRSEQNRLQEMTIQMKRDSTDRETRLRAAEMAQAGTSADVRAIQAGVARIEDKIDDIMKSTK